MLPIYKNDYKFWKQAYDLARNGEHRVRVGCLGVVSGIPTAGAWNRIRNVANVDFTDISIHAEMACINQISERQQPRTTLYIARINKKGQALPSHPCKRCLEKLITLDVKSVCVADFLPENPDNLIVLKKYKLKDK